jgi:hypothetical protein
MGKKKKLTKKLKEVPKVAARRSDLIVTEFGENARYRDKTMLASAASPHWNANTEKIFEKTV